MAFLRFARDKRGYEHFQLVQPAADRRGMATLRILYWFRSPPNVRVGREPFDEAVRSALEKHNPDLEFDWPHILATPIPSGEAERWRERRRQEPSARQSIAEDESTDAVEDLEADGPLPGNERTAEMGGDAAGTVMPAAARHSQQPGDAFRKKRRRRRGRHGQPDAPRAAEPLQELAAESPGSETESDPHGK